MLENSKQIHRRSYLILILLCCFIGSVFSFEKYPVYNSVDIDYIGVDSIPTIDTTFIYDPLTKTSKTVIDTIYLPEEEVLGEEHFDTTTIFNVLNYTEYKKVQKREGKLLARTDKNNEVEISIDTSIVFDSKTYKRTVQISEVTIPKNYSAFNISRNEAIEKYGSTSTYYIKTNKDSPHLPVSFARGHNGFQAELQNDLGKGILFASIPSISYFQDFGEIKNLSLPVGKYLLKRNDGGRTVEIIIE